MALQCRRPNSGLGGAQPDNSRRCAVQRDGSALLGLWQILGCLRRLPGESALPAALQCSVLQGLRHIWPVQHLTIHIARHCKVIHQLSGHVCWLVALMTMPLSLRCLPPATLCTLCKHQLPTLKCSLLAYACLTATLCVKPS